MRYPVFAGLILLLVLCVGIVQADYVLNVETLTSSPTDGQTVYFGNNPTAPSTTANRSPVAIPVSGTITKVEIYDYSGTAGSAESYTYYLRKNNVQDYLIATLTVSASERRFSNTTISVAVNAGDYFEIKRVQPTWATNPATNIVGGYVYIETTTPGYVLWGQGLTNTPGDNAVNYFGTKPGAPITTAGRAKIYVPSNGTITAVNVREYSGTAGTGETYGYRIRKNTGALEYVANLSAATNLRLFTNSSVNLAVTKTDYIEFARLHPNWSTNPATNIVGATAFIDTTSNTYDLAGFPVHVQAISSTMGDATTTYFGNLPKAPIASAGVSKIYLPKSGTITRAEIYTYSGTAGTAESWSLYVRKNNTQDYWIATNAVSAAERRFTNTTLGIPITAGDYIEIKSVQPTWATNPATTIIGGYVWLEYGVAADTAAPASITGLNNDTTDVTTINWSWTNPTDQDFNGTMIYQNDVFLKNASKVETIDNWSGLTEGTAYTFSTRTFDLTGNVNHTWMNKTETTLYSGENPIDITVRSGPTPIADSLEYITIPEQRSQAIASAIHTNLSVLFPPGERGESPIEFTDGFGQEISIKRIDYNIDDAKVGYWITATRNGEEVLTHSPVWVVNSPYESEEFISYNSRTNERTSIIREDPLAVTKTVLSGYVSRQPLGEAVGDDVLVVYLTEDTADEYVQQSTNSDWVTMRSGAGEATGDCTTSLNCVYLAADSSVADRWNTWRRGGFGFNTSSLPDNATISIAIFGVGIYGKLNGLGSLGLGITDFSPETANNFVATDYNNWVGTRYASDKTYADISTGAYANFTFTDDGRGAINKTGYTNFMMRFPQDIDNSTLGITWVASAESGYLIYDYTANASLRSFMEITYSLPDATPPASITGLTNNTATCTEINWTWTNPTDADFNHTMIYQNGTWLKNTSTAFDLWTGLTGGVEYTISTKTVDITGNVNATFTNMTATAATCTDTTPPTSISGLTNATTCNSVNWTWTEPTDADFNHTVIYQNGTWFNNLTNTTEYSLWEGLAEFTEHTFSSFTVDITGNENTSWVNQTARTPNCTPVAGFSAEPPTEGNAPLTVQFNDGSTGTIHIWNWSFGDGDYSDAQNPSHQYTTPGTYDVNLTVSNDNGEDFELYIGYVIVHNATPVANFTADITSGCVPQTVQFNDTSTGVVFNWSWKLNGVEFSTEQNATYEFTAPGLYEWVNLTVMNDGGADTYSWQDGFYFTDCGSPGSITDLANSTTACEQINWTWTNPSDADYNGTMIWQNGTWLKNTSSTTVFDLWTGLTGGVDYTFSSRTFDNATAPNVNDTFVNMTATPSACAVAPVANFTVDNTTVCLGSPFQFNDTSTNTPTVWYWMFGDTATSAVQNASHTYENTGTYSVYLNASNSGGFDWENKTNLVTVNDCTPPLSITDLNGTLTNCTSINWTWTLPKDGDYNQTMVYQNGTFLYNLTTETFDNWYNLSGGVEYIFSSRTVDSSGNVNQTWVNLSKTTDACGATPVANFTSNVTQVCIGDYVEFTDTSTNSPDTWFWLFGDLGVDSHLQNPITNTFDTVGLWNVSFNASNSYGFDWENKTDYIEVFDCTPPAAVTNLTNTTTTCEEITWTWDEPADPDFDYVYALRNGTWYGNYSSSPTTWSGLVGGVDYTISLQSVDTYGNVNETWVNMTATAGICPTPPVAAFSANDTSVCLGDGVQFTDASSNTPTAWNWSFGDGLFNETQNPLYTYAATGSFSVNLSASNADGDDWENKSNYITVTDCTPVANFTADDTTVCIGDNVTFTDTSTNTPNIWYWLFGDGNSSFLQNPSHNWSWAGDFNISLKAGNGYGDNVSTKLWYINVTDCTVGVSASFTSNVTCGVGNFSVQFTDTSTGVPTSWFWDFGEGVNSTEQNPVINYTATGMYGVDHSATNAHGTGWYNVSGYITARALGDTCAGGGDDYDSDDYSGNWFTSWWL